MSAVYVLTRPFGKGLRGAGGQDYDGVPPCRKSRHFAILTAMRLTDLFISFALSTRLPFCAFPACTRVQRAHELVGDASGI